MHEVSCIERFNQKTENVTRESHSMTYTIKEAEHIRAPLQFIPNFALFNCRKNPPPYTGQMGRATTAHYFSAGIMICSCDKGNDVNFFESQVESLVGKMFLYSTRSLAFNRSTNAYWHSVARLFRKFNLFAVTCKRQIGRSDTNICLASESALQPPENETNYYSCHAHYRPQHSARIYDLHGLWMFSKCIVWTVLLTPLAQYRASFATLMHCFPSMLYQWMQALSPTIT